MGSEELIRSGCAYCNSSSNLNPCKGGCMVALYCSQEHQKADEEEHKPKCQAIHEQRLEHLFVRNKIIEHVGPSGRTLMITATKAYLTNKAWLMEYLSSLQELRMALSQVHTRQAIEQEMELVEKWHGSQTIAEFVSGYMRVTPYLIRLDRDDECRPLYLDGLNDLRVHRDHTYRTPGIHILGLIQGCLLKILLRVRVAVDLVSLKMAAQVAGPKVPTEILDVIRREVVTSPLVWKKRPVLEASNHDREIGELHKDIQLMAGHVHSHNQYLWRSMFPDESFGKALDDLEMEKPQEVSEAEGTVEWLQKAWSESPGALDYLLGVLRKTILTDGFETR
ncbi:hypothetical protein P170DRAFT_493610 [Aspergillus steynii IBT 23096]|uniref:MYND-type domain-containing protein n=1 Tax=Aspergillus steynii IBT 23096 TaxID=1392250 RepID=A0A2I2GEN3_9EURO|nr:uncharacterized protein P170DRAFT_493610 [Aspergillus steynii IBT 23096]PLB51322.1 hypothetical protein P170DRAFT_493610 [Aspergillus steynii IBT 23096]